MLNRRLALMGLALLTSHPALAALPPPSGKKVLSISGRVGAPNQGANAVFDMPMLIRTTFPSAAGRPSRSSGLISATALAARVACDGGGSFFPPP